MTANQAGAPSSNAERLANPAYKACKACGEPVHHRNVSCKACSAPSPWKEPNEPPPEQRKWSAARTTREYIGILNELGIDTTDLVKVADEIEAVALLQADAKQSLTMADVELAKKIALENDPDRLEFNGPAETAAQVFMSKFSTQIGSVMCHFTPGMVIEDHVLIGQLIELKAPMVPVVTSKGMVCCPQCKTIFPAKPPVAPKRRG
jgi:hypothetical protein